MHHFRTKTKNLHEAKNKKIRKIVRSYYWGTIWVQLCKAFNNIRQTDLLLRFSHFFFHLASLLE